ncbi:hypothetical protein BP00DRAFT_459704 [Aspergillus indologenus CBS 114.80]|uniref:Uncharacterized protein n=1 Tax=Aspergillus indologenus CBS 114.80 TaxID=1450541 RepID=A0A2V5II10_9EURO|nr:hypothetical protein BP00DRAFT_459704 [Aspergillus indologenus CBS 114.80]
MFAAVDLHLLIGFLFVLFSCITGCYLASFSSSHPMNEAENEGTVVDVLDERGLAQQAAVEILRLMRDCVASFNQFQDHDWKILISGDLAVAHWTANAERYELEFTIVLPDKLKLDGLLNRLRRRYESRLREDPKGKGSLCILTGRKWVPFKIIPVDENEVSLSPRQLVSDIDPAADEGLSKRQVTGQAKSCQVCLGSYCPLQWKTILEIDEKRTTPDTLQEQSSAETTLPSGVMGCKAPSAGL